jgi:hypothetical protein
MYCRSSAHERSEHKARALKRGERSEHKARVLKRGERSECADEASEASASAERARSEREQVGPSADEASDECKACALRAQTNGLERSERKRGERKACALRAQTNGLECSERKRGTAAAAVASLPSLPPPDPSFALASLVQAPLAPCSWAPGLPRARGPEAASV